MKNIIDYIKPCGVQITEDLDMILESELIQEGFFSKLKAAWKGLKETIKNTSSWKAYQEKEKRYAQVDKEVEEEFNKREQQVSEIVEIKNKQDKKEEVTPEETNKIDKFKLDIAVEMVERVNRLNTAQEYYNKSLELGKKIGFNNIKDANKYIQDHDKQSKQDKEGKKEAK